MSNVAINRETGEILVLGAEGQWQPAQRARNPQTGAEVYNDGNQWLPVPQAPRPEPTTGESLARGAGLAARAVGPIAAGAAAGAAMGAPLAGVGAIPGAIAGAAAAGLAQPVADAVVGGYRAARDYLSPQQRTLSGLVAPQPQQRAPLPSEALQNVMTAAGLPQPETASERLASAALRAGSEAMTGVAAARQFAGVPLAAVSNGLPSQTAQLAARPPASPVARGVADLLASAPGAQTAAATTGAVATQGLLEAGAPPALALPGGIAASMLPMVRPQNIFPARGGAVRQGNVDLLREAGVPMSPAQELGNPSASVFESVMRYLPTSAPTVARAEDQTMRGYTRAINRMFGVDSDIATPEVLAAAQRGFGDRYRALEAATTLRPDQRFADDITKLRQTYVRGLDEGNFRAFDFAAKRLEDFVAARAQGAEMPGVNYHMIDGELRTAANLARRSENPSIREYGNAMDQLRESLQGLMERSARASAPPAAPSGAPQLRGPNGQAQLPGPSGGNVPALRAANDQPPPSASTGQGSSRAGEDLAEAWRNTNREYALFSRVREAMGNATGRDKLNTGFIPPNALAQTERSSIGPEAYATSRDPFTRLVRAGQAVLPDPVPNSGTAQRSFAQDMLTGARRGAPAAGAGVAAGASGVAAIDPMLSLALPWGASKLWYGRPIGPQQQGLLGLRALYGSMQAQE